MKNDVWIEWGGGTIPVKKMDLIEVKFREAHDGKGLAYWFAWSHIGANDDIIAYRVIENDGREG